jgi:hypothetical protein
MSGPPALEGGGAWIPTRAGRVPDQGTAKTTADTEPRANRSHGGMRSAQFRFRRWSSDERL